MESLAMRIRLDADSGTNRGGLQGAFDDHPADERTMKAFVYERYGSPDVLELRDVDVPEPGDEQVLVRVRAASVNPYDWHFMRGQPYFMRLFVGLRKPKRTCLGADVAGVVEAVGTNVTRFRKGDEVFGDIAENTTGSFGQYVCVPASELEHKPSNASFEQAAAIPIAGLTALQGLRDKGRLERGQTVLINGASGGVGTYAVQIAKAFGANVTAVCSTRNLELVRSIGADHVVDYTQESFTEGGQRYDVFFDCIGNHSLTASRRVVATNGIYVGVGSNDHGVVLGPLKRMLRLQLLRPFVSQTMVTLMAKKSGADLQLLKDMHEAGSIRSVIDRTYSLTETPEAIRYVEKGHARGKVVITV